MLLDSSSLILGQVKASAKIVRFENFLNDTIPAITYEMNILSSIVVRTKTVLWKHNATMIMFWVTYSSKDEDIWSKNVENILAHWEFK